jgi:hypothetical protein
LQRGALITGLLAIIAGILGMHVMTGNHGVHGSGGNHAAAASVDRVHPGAGGHAGHADASAHAGHSEHTGHSEHSGAAAIAAPAFVSDSCAGSCQDLQESGGACVPSANTSSLTVFPPHETSGSFRSAAETPSGLARAEAFTPPSPTPCELSISRT